MSSCEKCWNDSKGNADIYQQLLSGRLCTPEEQAGPEAAKCPVCGRMTLHQYTREPMCGCDAAEERR